MYVIKLYRNKNPKRRMYVIKLYRNKKHIQFNSTILIFHCEMVKKQVKVITSLFLNAIFGISNSRTIFFVILRHNWAR